tara:strand:+ start:130 stop:336 length:207 start_codon:yes stop_codon:yes gene_type:complete
MPEINPKAFEEKYNSYTSEEINKEILYRNIQTSQRLKSIKTNVQVITWITVFTFIIALVAVFLVNNEI